MVSIKRSGFLYHLESSVVDPDPHHFCIWIRIRIHRNKNTDPHQIKIMFRIRFRMKVIS